MSGGVPLANPVTDLAARPSSPSKHQSCTSEFVLALNEGTRDGSLLRSQNNSKQKTPRQRLFRKAKKEKKNQTKSQTNSSTLIFKYLLHL